jgi:hypothetical protein
MNQMIGRMMTCAAIAAFASLAFSGAPAYAAKTQCAVKAADGTGISEKAAKFQVYEALLQATDWGAWASWMSNGTTPGYKVGNVKYKCQSGTGLGATCRGQAKICKL